MYTVMHGSTAHGASGFVDKFVELSIDKKHKNLEKETTFPLQKRKFNCYTLRPAI